MAEVAAEFLGGEGVPLGAAEALFRIYRALRRLHLANRVAGNTVVIVGGLENAVQQRPARHDAVVAELALKLVLPALHQLVTDDVERLRPERRAPVQP